MITLTVYTGSASAGYTMLYLFRAHEYLAAGRKVGVRKSESKLTILLT